VSAGELRDLAADAELLEAALAAARERADALTPSPVLQSFPAGCAACPGCGAVWLDYAHAAYPCVSCPEGAPVDDDDADDADPFEARTVPPRSDHATALADHIDACNGGPDDG
jgi:hypothetical protein